MTFMKSQSDRQRISFKFIFREKTCRIFLLSFLLSLFSLSCKDEGTPPIELPEGYQQDIPWPSLADSPWPMNHHDPQSTGRGKYIGPRLGICERFVNTPELQTGIVIGKDSTLYFTSSSISEGGLFAFKPDSILKWKLKTMHSYSTPIIANDGTIYYKDLKCLQAVSPEGKILWTYDGNESGASIRPISIGKDGTIYFLGSDKYLRAVDKKGLLLWELYDERFSFTSRNDIVFSPDGKSVYMAGSNEEVIAVDIELKKIKWTFGKPTVDTKQELAPIIDCSGNIYFQARDENNKLFFYCLKEDGTVKWYHKTNDLISAQGTIDINGNVYFAGDSLHSFDYKGNLRWKISLNGFLDCSLVCDSEGTVYAGVSGNKIIAVDKNGSTRWIVSDLPIEGFGSSPALFNGVLYLPTNNQMGFYIIK